MAYAETTSVAFEKSVAEIITLIKRHRAGQIGQFEGDDFFAVQFKLADRLIGLAERLTDAQREAALEGRVTECPYHHPTGTRCPNCAKWPFKKGGSAEFIAAVRAALSTPPEGTRDD